MVLSYDYLIVGAHLSFCLKSELSFFFLPEEAALEAFIHS